ncbi:hypothetical protein BD408DRAFT_208627 [Parasitella parasitica]|nr:hypothetical protein BD408DRAFT_208627 [Parasitella parasitica]
MSYCILLDSSGNKGAGDSGPRKKKGKEKAKDVASSIPADFFEDEKYEDFQVPIGLRPPPSTIAREQRDIEEATRLSLQRQGVAESGESSSSTNVRQTPQIARSTVIADFEEDDDFQEAFFIRPRTTRATTSVTTPVQASTQSTGMPIPKMNYTFEFLLNTLLSLIQECHKSLKRLSVSLQVHLVNPLVPQCTYPRKSK